MIVLVQYISVYYVSYSMILDDPSLHVTLDRNIPALAVLTAQLASFTHVLQLDTLLYHYHSQSHHSIATQQLVQFIPAAQVGNSSPLLRERKSHERNSRLGWLIAHLYCRSVVPITTHERNERKCFMVISIMITGYSRYLAQITVTD